MIKNKVWQTYLIYHVIIDYLEISWQPTTYIFESDLSFRLLNSWFSKLIDVIKLILIEFEINLNFNDKFTTFKKKNKVRIFVFESPLLIKINLNCSSCRDLKISRTLIWKIKKRTSLLDLICFKNFLKIYLFSFGRNNWKRFQKEEMEKAKATKKIISFFLWNSTADWLILVWN